MHAEISPQQFGPNSIDFVQEPKEATFATHPNEIRSLFLHLFTGRTCARAARGRGASGLCGMAVRMQLVHG